jgi:hypothetical protein
MYEKGAIFGAVSIALTRGNGVCCISGSTGITRFLMNFIYRKDQEPNPAHCLFLKHKFGTQPYSFTLVLSDCF